MSYFQAGVAWVCEHPYQTAMHTVNAALLVTPAAATVPIFNALGFSAAGPIAGTLISSYASRRMNYSSFVTNSSTRGNADSCRLQFIPNNRQQRKLIIKHRIGSKQHDELLWLCPSGRRIRDCPECRNGRLRSRSGSWSDPSRCCCQLGSGVGIGSERLER